MRTGCPHCGRIALTAARKLALGPARSVPCRRCGLAVGVAVGPALIAFLPCAAMVVAVPLQLLHGAAAMIAAGVSAIAVTGALYLLWVPLVPRQLSDARALRAADAREASPEAKTAAGGDSSST